MIVPIIISFAAYYGIYRWSQGLIQGVEFEVGDEYWSRNVKKGVISLLQVNLRQQNRLSSHSFDYDRRRSSWAINRFRRFRSPFVRRQSYTEANVNSVHRVMEVNIS